MFDGFWQFFNDILVILSTSAVNVKNLSKEYIDNLDKDTKEKLTAEDITDHDRYILNHKLDVIDGMRI